MSLNRTLPAWYGVILSQLSLKTQSPSFIHVPGSWSALPLVSVRVDQASKLCRCDKPLFTDRILRIASYLVLMIHKFVTSDAFKAEILKARRDPLTKWSQLRKLSPIMYLLIRDGVLYFAMCVTVCAIAALSFHLFLITVDQRPPTGCSVSLISSFMACNTLLNILANTGAGTLNMTITARFSHREIQTVGVP